MTWELLQRVHRYAAHVDDRLPVSAVFTPDAVLVLPDPPECLDPVHEHLGHVAISLAMEQLATIPRTFHEIVGSLFTVDGSTATGRVACVAHHLLDPQTDLVWHLRYLDDYRLTEQGGLIDRRAVHLDTIETRKLKRARLS